MTTLADVLAVHRPHETVNKVWCSCRTWEGRSGWVNHIEAAVAAAGLAVIQLPERGMNPDGYSWNAGDDTVFYDKGDRRKVSIVVLESSAGEAQLVFPDNPLALAGALVAAEQVTA